MKKVVIGGIVSSVAEDFFLRTQASCSLYDRFLMHIFNFYTRYAVALVIKFRVRQSRNSDLQLPRDRKCNPSGIVRACMHAIM
jgi:hypothetical protein